MSELLKEQLDVCHRLSRVVENLKKKGVANITVGMVQSRIDGLESMWADIQKNHRELKRNATAEMLVKHEYFRENCFDSIEESFLDQRGVLLDFLKKLESKPSSAGQSKGCGEDERQRSRTILPRIDLPTFDGQFKDWTAFHDLFDSLIIQDSTLKDVERLHYLKSCLKGEAAMLINNVPITEANFKRAWTTLTERFENKRLLVRSQMVALSNIPAVKRESATDLKRLLYGTWEVIGALAEMGRPVTNATDWIVYHTVEKLDNRSRREWETSLGPSTEPPSLDDLKAFLETRVNTIEAWEQRKTDEQTDVKKPPKAPPKVHQVASDNQLTKSCDLCDKKHYLLYCPLFRKKTPEERKSVLLSNHRCLNCLGKHPTYDCSSVKRCQQCAEKHHSCIHEASSASGASVQHVTPNRSPVRSVILGLARVHVHSPVGRRITVRALIDPGSEVSLITERVVVNLGLIKERARVPLSLAGGSTHKTTKGRTKAIISSIHDPQESLRCTALILAKLTDYTPNCMPKLQPRLGLDGLQLADPFLSNNDPVDLLLGADVYSQLLLDGVRRRGPNLPVAQETRLGWILTGSIGTEKETATIYRAPTVQLCTSAMDLAGLLQRFWEQEEVSVKKPPTQAEQECEDHFSTTYRRTSEGRFEVRLPFKGCPELGPSRPAAMRTLESMERRYQRSEEFHHMYKQFMDEYIQLGHMTVARSPPAGGCFYLPHHGVLRPSSTTTKLRVVFNGSLLTSSGKSLNDYLHAGPNLLPALPDVLLRWRAHPVVLVADIEKMFRQIVVHPDDRDYQRILWRPRPGIKLREFTLNTVTYGLTCAPYLAQRCLRQLALDEEHRFPRAARVLSNDIYMDDVLSGAASLADAGELKTELELLCRAGGFILHKWASNAPELEAPRHPQDNSATQPKHWDTGSQHSVLGIKWVPEIDCFQIRIQDATITTTTKRSVLRQTAQIFDPLGWLSPATVLAKILFQSLWLLKADWDDPLPPQEEKQWRAFLQGLPALRSIKLPRWLGVTSASRSVEIHGFSDASERAYAAVVYLRVENSKGQVTTKLLGAKTKVAPLKQVSLPRLELCGAHLLAKLVSHFQETLSLETKQVHLWSDSRVALGWIQAHSSRWQTYVANRVAEIQRLQPKACWHHVKGSENPADVASRGVPPSVLPDHALWWNGPSWLTLHLTWPDYKATTTLPEERRQIHHTLELHTDEVSELINRFSDLHRLLRTIAWCCRWLRPHQGVRKRYLGAKEIDDADRRLVRWVQSTTFPQEMASLRKERPISKKSRLLKLNPFLDESGILRVGGRLQLADLDYEQKHPMIIPEDSPLTALRIRQEHLRCLHGGVQITLATLRRRYWVLRGRQAVKAVINRCLTCVRWRGTTAGQLMGTLPLARVTACRPFLRVGTDYAGPISLRSTTGRGHRVTKGYIALFICLSSRAVHLEVVSDGTTNCFLAALRRLVARRGLCAQIYSDCGTVFVGANRELKSLLEALSPTNRKLLDSVASMGIDWQFNPPSAPHFGGIWEAAVKSTKHHLRRIIGEQTLTYEEFATLLTQVEACLNSRPLQSLSDDPQDLEALTPGHFLIGAPLTAVPEPSLDGLPRNRLSRWQLLQQLQQSFWKRWSRDYLNTLQTRSKWCQPRPVFQEGDLCLIKNELLPPTRWPLARIIKTHPGPDGLPRVVTLRTATLECSRPIHRLIPLPPRDAEKDTDKTS